MQFFKRKDIYFKSIVKRAAALAAMIIITVSSVVTVAAATCNANIEYNGKKKSVQLFSRDTKDILAAAGITAGTGDAIVRKETQASGGDINITVRSAYKVTVSADNTTKTVVAHYGDTVGAILRETGITPGTKDMVTPPEDTKVTDAVDVAINRKFNVTVTADGKTQTAVVAEGSVQKALSQAGIALDSKDIVSADKSAPVTEGMKLTVSRVTYQEVTDTVGIAYANENKNDSTILKGVKKIQTSGKKGTQSVITRQKLIDGKLAGSEVVKTTVTEKPVNQVTLVGTKKKPSAYASISGDGKVVDQDGNTVSYRKCITGRCTAYSGGGWTSTGRAASFGLVAVNPKVIPYGSKLYICSPDGRTVYGYAIAADTGGGVMDGRIVADLYYSTSSQCKNFGVRNMSIYVL